GVCLFLPRTLGSTWRRPLQASGTSHIALLLSPSGMPSCPDRAFYTPGCNTCAACCAARRVYRIPRKRMWPLSCHYLQPPAAYLPTVFSAHLRLAVCTHHPSRFQGGGGQSPPRSKSR